MVLFAGLRNLMDIFESPKQRNESVSHLGYVVTRTQEVSFRLRKAIFGNLKGMKRFG